MSEVSHSSPQVENQTAAQLRELLEAFRRGLGNDLLAVVLFGSRARGEATNGSDWDLLLIARHLPLRPLQRSIYLKSLLPVEWRSRVSLLARTPEEFQTNLSSLILDIALDAVVLYDPEDYANERLAAVRRMLDREGLHRERVGKDFIWTWEHFPGFDWSLSWADAR